MLRCWRKPQLAFFVEQSSKSKSNKEIKRLDVELISIGKRAGLSFSEINEFSCQDLLDYVDAFTGAKDDKPRMATQEDIDKFFA